MGTKKLLIMEFIYKPWPWYVAGPLIGLTVPLLLLMGNKKLGVSSTLRQVCAACVPANVPLLKYDWKKDIWNLYFVAGIAIGGFLGGQVFVTPEAKTISMATEHYLTSLGLHEPEGLMPRELFNWESLTEWRGLLLIVAGGFMVGFGTRYARGCTSGHGIMGLSALQWPSLLATISFFVGGIVVSHFVLPYIIAL